MGSSSEQGQKSPLSANRLNTWSEWCEGSIRTDDACTTNHEVCSRQARLIESVLKLPVPTSVGIRGGDLQHTEAY